MPSAFVAVWFFLAVISGAVWMFGPYTESECDALIADAEDGTKAICIEKGHKFLTIPPLPGVIHA